MQATWFLIRTDITMKSFNACNVGIKPNWDSDDSTASAELVKFCKSWTNCNTYFVGLNQINILYKGKNVLDEFLEFLQTASPPYFGKHVAHLSRNSWPLASLSKSEKNARLRKGSNYFLKIGHNSIKTFLIFVSSCAKAEQIAMLQIESN